MTTTYTGNYPDGLFTPHAILFAVIGGFPVAAFIVAGETFMVIE